jgi:hypothetical protein
VGDVSVYPLLHLAAFAVQSIVASGDGGRGVYCADAAGRSADSAMVFVSKGREVLRMREKFFEVFGCWFRVADAGRKDTRCQFVLEDSPNTRRILL